MKRFLESLQRLLMAILIVLGVMPLAYFTLIEVGVDENDTRVMAQEPTSRIDRLTENNAFGVGEHFEFDINYGFINAGTAAMSTTRLIEYEGRPCYQVVTTAHSNDFFTTFYPVRDSVESIVDAIGLFSWRFEKRLREGNYHADRTFMIEQRFGLVYSGKDTLEVPPFVQDPLSALYFVRTQPLTIGKSLRFAAFADGKNYELEVRVVKKETITVDAGTFDCIVVEPLLQGVGVFRHEGSLKVWLTDDRLRMPVLMKSKVLVGSISAELTAYTLGDIEVF